ncbi:MAG: type II toxin-antitoxin system HicA family toxin [Rudaea sp.]
MSRLPSVTGRKLIAALKRLGFKVIRVRGSHHYLQHADGRATVVPVHAGEDIGRGLLAQILRDADITDAVLKKTPLISAAIRSTA